MSKRGMSIVGAGAIALALMTVQPAVAGPIDSAAGATPASTNTGGVKRCAGGPTVFAGVHLSSVPAGTEVVFHNLTTDGSGSTGFTITGQPGPVDVWGPYTQASWKILSLGNISDVHGVCSS